MHNLKFHVIAVSIIVTLIVAIYFALSSAPPPAEPPQEQTDVQKGRYIEIARATWGRNCDEMINAYLTRQRKTGTALPKNMEKAQDNNVLLEVSDLCNNNIRCEIPVTPDVLGNININQCAKTLEVQYRCFSWDRTNIVSAESYDTLVIDCTQP